MPTTAPIIDPEHVHSETWSRHASPLSLIVLGSILGAALLGWAGGTSSPTHVVASPALDLEIRTPATIRNGEFFETQVKVRTKVAFDDLTLVVDPDLWRDVTVNTFMPGAADESSEKGAFRFSFGPVPAGQTLSVKIDGQINPSRFGGSSGDMSIFDGDRRVARQPLKLRVLP